VGKGEQRTRAYRWEVSKVQGDEVLHSSEYTVAKVTKVGRKLEIKGMDREANDTEVYTVDCAGIGCDWSEIIME